MGSSPWSPKPPRGDWQGCRAPNVIAAKRQSYLSLLILAFCAAWPRLAAWPVHIGNACAGAELLVAGRGRVRPKYDMEVQRLCPDRPFSSSILRTKPSKFCVLPWLAKVPRFSRRGQAEQGLDMVRRHRPTVIVLDEDSEAAWSGQLTAQYDEQSQQHHTPLLVLGTARRRHRLPLGGVCGETLSLRAAGP